MPTKSRAVARPPTASPAAAHETHRGPPWRRASSTPGPDSPDGVTPTPPRASCRSRRAAPMSGSRVRGSLRRHRSSRRRTASGVPSRQRLEIGLLRHHRRDHVGDGVAGEERAAGEHLPQQDAEGPDVGPLVHRLARGPARATCTRPCRGSCRPPCRRRASVGDCDIDAETALLSAPSPAQALARPKSRTFTFPSGVSFTLAGLRSRWTMPLRVRLLEGLGDLRRRSRGASSTGIAPRSSRSARSSPSTSSRTRNGCPVGLLEAVDGGDVRVVEGGEERGPRAGSGPGARGRSPPRPGGP